MNNVNDIALEINKRIKGHEIAKLHDFRKRKVPLARGKVVFSKITTRDDYAFHYGGRKELQFNIGLDSEVFRYGVAFSMVPSRSEPNLVDTLKPLINRFNRFVRENKDYFSGFSMWYWKNERRHDFQSVEEIKDELINNGIFIFIGKKTTKQISSFTDNDVDKIIECFDYLYELYRYVQSGRELVGRLCWNTNHWISPSGRKGKSSNKGSYEYKMGFGNEEWLFDKTKLIKGYHYGFLQPINHNRNKYIGNVFDIHLYTINSETKETWWLGMINNAWIVDAEESEKVYNEYKKRGFLKEMIHQLEVIEADVKELSLTTPQNFFNVKYKPNDLRLLDEPQKVSNKDKSISGKYYSSFNTYISTPQSITIEPKIFTLQGDSNPSDILKTTRYYSYGVSEVNLSHNIMVASSLKQLKKECDKAFANVSTTQGTFVDVVTEDKGKCIFYEFKISPTFKACIREALSQIMEYAYYPDRTIAHKLIIVSGNDINEDGKKYMKRLRTEFRIPVYYQKFNFDTERLESTLY